MMGNNFERSFNKKVQKDLSKPIQPGIIHLLPFLKLTFSPLQNDGWKIFFPFGMAYFQGRTVSFREGKPLSPGNSVGDLCGMVKKSRID